MKRPRIAQCAERRWNDHKERQMSYILFLSVALILLMKEKKNGIYLDEFKDTFWICLAILSAGEAIGLRVGKNK